MESNASNTLPRPVRAILVVRCQGQAPSIRDSFGRGIFQVRNAPDGDVAVASFVRDPPDLLLLDGGKDVATRVRFWNEIRSQHTFAAIRRPLMVLSSMVSPGLQASILDDGADCFVATPVSEGLLLCRVETLLRRRSETEMITRAQSNVY